MKRRAWVLFTVFLSLLGGASCADDPSQGGEEAYAVAGDALLVATPGGQLTASDGAAGSYFGLVMALSTDASTLIVGAEGDDIGGNSSQGSAYVFVRSGAAWTEQAKLTAPGGAALDLFGNTVAVSGDGSTAVIGAYASDQARGSVHVFTRSGATWTEQAELTAPGGAAGDFFGWSAAVSGDGSTALVGAYNLTSAEDKGSAYVFTRSGTTWTQQAKLTASDGAAGDGFGYSLVVSEDGSTAVIGAPGDGTGSNPEQGSAYVFTRGGATWTEQAKLTAAGGAAGDGLGWSVAVSGNGSTAILGALASDQTQGSAYVFTRSGATWTEQAKLAAADGAAGDLLGLSVAVSNGGDLVVIGSTCDDVGDNANQGSAYVFTRSGTTWTEQLQLLAPNGAAFDRFGDSVAVSGDGRTAVIGAVSDFHGSSPNPDSAYVFTLSVHNGTACSTGSECASGFCADGVCCDTACADGACDACSVAAGAPVDGTCAPLTGPVCDDGNACTQTDTCQSGACVGADPVTCAAQDQCHLAGACNPANGHCANPAAPDGTSCSDGHACSLGDTCHSGTCAAGPLRTTGPCTPVCLAIQQGSSGAVADALIDSVRNTQNFGATVSLTAGTVAGVEYQALLRFDLSAIPSDAFVISATARLTLCLYGGAPVSAHAITSPWNQATVTWSSFGGAFDPAVAATFPAATALPSPAAPTVKSSANLLALAKAWVSGATPNHGVLLTTTPSSPTVFCSSEYNLGVTPRPRLDVCYVPGI